MNPEQQFWRDEVAKAAHSELASVQKVASNWKSLSAALTGLVATGIFAGGKETLDKLQSPWPNILRVLTVIALALGLLAAYLFARIDGLTVQVSNDNTWETRMATTRDVAGRAYKRLPLARRVGVAFAAAVFLGSSATLFLPREASSPPTVVVVTGAGSWCGTLGADATGMTVGGRSAARATSITPVSKCS